MKKNSFLWAALSMTAALVMTACSNDDNANESPVQQSTVKTIPYSVTVNEGATTRATVESDNKTLKFAVGDKLYISGTDIQGVLYIQSGTGTTFATFSGYLTYSGSGTPASDLSLTATLVSAQQNVGTEVSVDAAGAVTVNYPTTSYCGDVAEAVQKYSNLTGTSTYGMKSFSLTQQTAFLNFVITFEDGTTTGTGLSAVVSNNSTAICTANVTTTTESEKVVAKFVLPVASGTTLSSATVTMGSKAALNITNATLTGKVYNVRKTQAAATYTMAANAVAGDVGKLICTDGHIHTYNADAACTKSRVAKIIYIGTTGHATYSHGLALALTDEGQMTWGAAMTACNTTKNRTLLLRMQHGCWPARNSGTICWALMAQAATPPCATASPVLAVLTCSRTSTGQVRCTIPPTRGATPSSMAIGTTPLRATAPSGFVPALLFNLFIDLPIYLF